MADTTTNADAFNVPSSISVEVKTANGESSISLERFMVKKENGFRYEAAVDLILATDQADDALRAMSFAFNGERLNMGTVHLSKAGNRSKGGNLTVTHGPVVTSLNGIAYNVQVQATAVVRKVNGEQVHVINVRPKAFRKAANVGSTFKAIGSLGAPLTA